jgi:hypothetical protein
MATFLTMSGTPLSNNILLVVGNTLKFKIEGTLKELVPFNLISTAPLILAATHVNVRIKANSEVFTMKALASGLAGFSAVNSKGIIAGPIAVKIRVRLQLPDATTEAGAMARLILAEVPTPFSVGYKLKDAETGMQWIRIVIENRLKAASGRFGSAGAKTRIDVMKSPGQFKGFSNYPNIDASQAGTIQDVLDTANDGTNANSNDFFNHVTAAINVLSKPAIKDPATEKPWSNGLLGWRTAGASSPGGDFVKFKTFAGQDFYTVK